jgi:hypothetical protein
MCRGALERLRLRLLLLVLDFCYEDKVVFDQQHQTITREINPASKQQGDIIFLCG